ncbi:SWIM-type domain-containing protein [Abeliophyllum distichum]|uniref:SWIM-type domain-containing protein n=1 Tax=Abeliophyllum distichum TaxID=126358 RepID=A0ABD1P2M8_9LAMI
MESLYGYNLQQMMVRKDESNLKGPTVKDRNDGHISVEEEDVEVENHDEEERAVEDGGLLIESDYEMEEEHKSTNEDDNRIINFDFEFGTTDGQQPKDSDTEYEDSNDLQSVDSEDDAETSSRKRSRLDAFNPLTDLENPTFIIGMTFESKAMLKSAIIAHLVKNNREIKYKKDDANKLRAICKGDCPWVLYATKEHKKTSFAIKTYTKGHTCAMVYKNFGVNSTYLDERTTTQVQGHAGEIQDDLLLPWTTERWFLRGCRRVNGLDGYFLKIEHGRQLLTAVGVDRNNGMYLLAYAVVEIENGENWRWFLGLLKDDLHMNNSHDWTFISDKQKGLVSAIKLLFEHSEHRTCVRHLYNNFSATHKGIALKNCLWDAARATTETQWLEYMQSMLDIEPVAYGWLESKPASHWTNSHFREWTNCDMLFNNLCESFNNTIVNTREKPILTMLEEIRVYLMKRIVVRREAYDKWIAEVGPRIQKILEKNSKQARMGWADYSRNKKFQVKHNLGDALHAIDLRAKTCTCRSWQLTGIPCFHVIASVVSRGLTVIGLRRRHLQEGGKHEDIYVINFSHNGAQVVA